MGRADWQPRVDVALWHLLIVGPLAAGVMWLALHTLRTLLRPSGEARGEIARMLLMLLMLFAWSFVLGVVIRWVRL
jgi:hypothetical protein